MNKEGKTESKGPVPYTPPDQIPRPSQPVADSAIGHQHRAPQRPVSIPEHIGKQVTGSERLYRGLSYGFALLRGILVVLLILILFNSFVATVFRISGMSMYPSFEDGEFIMVDRLSFLVGDPHRGDVVIIRFPGDPAKRKFIKRVVGLPGETVKIADNTVFIDNNPLPEKYLPAYTPIAPNLEKTLRGDEYFVMGDNRPNSNDSRFFGPVPRHNFIGVSRAVLSGKAFGFIAQPAF